MPNVPSVSTNGPAWPAKTKIENLVRKDHASWMEECALPQGSPCPSSIPPFVHQQRIFEKVYGVGGRRW